MTDHKDPHAESVGLLGSVQRLVATLIETVETRVAIIATEFEEERERLRELVVFGFLALFFGSLGVVLLTLFVVIFFWETDRYMVVGGMAAAYIVAGTGFALLLQRRMKQRSRLFAATLSEMAKDRASLGSKTESS